MLRQIILTALLTGLCTSGASAQFISLDAGTDGVNFHVSNYAPAPGMPMMLTLPLGGVSYRPNLMFAPVPAYHHKAVRKAVKAYNKEIRHHGYYYPSPALIYVGYDYDDDDYEDYMEDMYKARKKAYKHYKKEMKKHYKHHKHHHHHDYDDDDDD